MTSMFVNRYLRYWSLIFPLSSLFYRMWRHFSLDDLDTQKVPGVAVFSPAPGSTPDKLLRQLAKNAKSLRTFSIASMPTIAENKTLQRMPFQTQILCYGRWFHLAFGEKLIQLNKLPPNVVKSFSRAKSGVWFFFCSRNRATNLHWALEALVVGSVGCLQREEIC